MLDEVEYVGGHKLDEQINRDNSWSLQTINTVGGKLKETESETFWGQAIGMLGDVMQKIGDPQVSDEDRIKSQMELATKLKEPLLEALYSPDKSAIPTLIEKDGGEYKNFWQLLLKLSGKSGALRELDNLKAGILAEVTTEMIFQKLGPKNMLLKSVPLDTDWGCGFDFVAMDTKSGLAVAKIDAKASMDQDVRLVAQDMRLPKNRWAAETKGMDALCAGDYGIKDYQVYAETPLFDIQVPSTQSHPDLYRHPDLPFLSDVGIAILDEANVDKLLGSLAPKNTQAV